VLGIVGLAALGLSSLGCARGPELQHAIGRYEVGHYRSAASSCASLADELEAMSDKSRVRYQVYCGLANYRLGHVHEARSLLAEGNAGYVSGDLGWLKPAVVDELLKALDELERGPSVGDADAFAGRASATDAP
jgi:hypothetical protein